ncbi:MAG TPA: S8 family peptidase, partial [Longimicrobium sp.]|nr:S8 family peptidase [Longimicrobium sp.]
MNPIRMSAAVLAMLALAACADQPMPADGTQADAAPLLSAQAGRGVPGEYIVVLRDDAEPRAVAAAAGAHPRHVYTAALNGFAAELNAGQLNALRHHPAVAYVEQDQVATAQQSIHWGLDRIDQKFLPLNGSYSAATTASTVYAYVIDTGITPTHAELTGRVVNVYDAFGGTGADCNGHGTLVSRVIGSSTVGVATAVRLRGVRVLDCNGSGTTSGIIAGIDWVRVNRTNPAVANLSLGGGASSAMNTAVNNLANSGVAVAVAAGSGGVNACNVSPGGATAALTATASTIADAHAAGSNFGSCVDLYAPGSAPGNAAGGTSMASAYVAGVAALYKATFGNQPTTTVNSWITTNATPGILTGVPAGTPNRLLY